MSAEAEDRIYLKAVFSRLTSTVLLGAAIVAVFTLIGVGIAFLSTPLYQATVLLAPAGGDQGSSSFSLPGQLGGLASLAGLQIGDSGDQTSEALAILKSRQFLHDFVDSEGIEAALAAKIEGEEVEAGTVSFNRIYSYMTEKMLRIVQSQDTGLIEVSLFWTDREQASAWSNLLVKRLNNELRARDIQEAQRSLEYLKSEVTNTSIIELRASLFDLIQEQVARIMLAKVREDYALTVIDPAVVPDEGDYAKPQRALIVGLGFLCGLFVWVFYVLIVPSPGR